MSIYNMKPAFRVLRPALAVLALGACSSDSLNVPNPDRIKPEDVRSAAGAQVVRNGAVVDFYSTFSGSQDGVIVMSGAMADETEVTDTFADRQRASERNLDPILGGAQNSMYSGLHKARNSMIAASRYWSEYKPQSKDSLAEIYTYKGYTENLLAEIYCSGVPFSYEDANGQAVFGMPLTRELEHFIDCMRTRAEPRTNGEEAIGVLRILTAGTVGHD